MRTLFNIITQSSLFVIISCQLFSTAQAASNEMYQWKDANGRTHFSDTPPLGQESKSQQIDIEFTKEQANNKTKKDSADTENTTQKSDTKQEQEPETSNLKNKAECKKVRDNLAQLNNPRPLRYTNKEGETGLITPEERKKQITRLKKLASDYCD